MILVFSFFICENAPFPFVRLFLSCFFYGTVFCDFCAANRFETHPDPDEMTIFISFPFCDYWCQVSNGALPAVCLFFLFFFFLRRIFCDFRAAHTGLIDAPDPSVVWVVELLAGHDADALDDRLHALAPVLLPQLRLALLLQQHREHLPCDLDLLLLKESIIFSVTSTLR